MSGHLVYVQEPFPLIVPFLSSEYLCPKFDTMLLLHLLFPLLAAYVHASPSPTADDEQCNSAPLRTVDTAKFASVADVRRITSRICQGGLRLPGSPGHLATVEYIRRQLSTLPEIQLNESDFEIANWQPEGNSLYSSAELRVDGQIVDIASAIAYSLPTNGSAISGTHVPLVS